MKLNVAKLATAAGVVMALGFGWTTIAALLGVPGFLPFANLLEAGYSSYGYSISWTGVVVGAVWGFIEGFLSLGLLALIYNKLAGKK
jgi:hypothetical protein